MRLLIVGIIGLLSFVACGPINQNDTQVEPGNAAKMDASKFAFLSDAAKANGMLLREKMKTMWKQKLEICGQQPAVSPEIREQIKAIRNDEALDKVAKRAQIKTIMEPLKPAKQALRAALKQCKQEKADQLQPLKDQRKALKAACLGTVMKKDGDTPKGMDKKGRWMGGFMAKLKNLSDAEKSELNTKLESAECTAILGK